MANEGKLTVSMSATGGLATGSLEKSFDWVATQGAAQLIQAIGTTEEPIAFTDIGTNGYIVLKNLDATNYIQVGVSTGVYAIRLKAGEVAAFHFEPGASLVAKANTAACRLAVWHLGGV